MKLNHQTDRQDNNRIFSLTPPLPPCLDLCFISLSGTMFYEHKQEQTFVYVLNMIKKLQVKHSDSDASITRAVKYLIFYLIKFYLISVLKCYFGGLDFTQVLFIRTSCTFTWLHFWRKTVATFFMSTCKILIAFYFLLYMHIGFSYNFHQGNFWLQK